MSIDYQAIGKRVKEFRCARKLTQEALAEMIDAETSTISHIEHATTKLSLPMLVKLANALDVTADELLYGTLIKSSHVSIKIIEDLLTDCTPNEVRALIEMIKTTKRILRAAPLE
jgi:transcriptional regulator with XRE-family HTH domain